MPSHGWLTLSDHLSPCLSELNETISTDRQFLAFSTTKAIKAPIKFGWISAGSDQAMLCTVGNGVATVTCGPPDGADFILSALPEQWYEFYQPVPKMPYQSYWGMYGQNIHQDGVEVLGNHDLFINCASLWRRILELSHLCLNGPVKEDVQESVTQDLLVGRYTYIESPHWGKTKLFYEQCGDEGGVDILFLHTAGSDGRQYHAVMNDPRMYKKYRMTVIDLPGHGRSFPSETQLPGLYSNNEDAYVGTITAVIQKLKLKRPIVCGASMAGHVCLAIATRAAEVGVGGVIPCQGCEHTPMERKYWDRSPFVNQSLFNPEYTYGMMSPTAPLENRNLVWHTYSAQAYSIFHGDLEFYFGGWDGRGRVEKIDTESCPVYMLTGEYDWSNTPDMSERTAKKIKGAQFKTMKGVGHFPATENPKVFVDYLLEAMAFITKSQRIE